MFLHTTFDPAELAKSRRSCSKRSGCTTTIARRDDPRSVHAHDVERLEPRASRRSATRETVSALTRDDLRDAHARALRPEHGGRRGGGQRRSRSRSSSSFAARSTASPGRGERRCREAPALTPERVVKHKDTEQAYVVLGTRGLSLRDERRYALSVLDTILGGGMSSRLFQEVREKRGLAYSVYSFQQGYREAGLFAVSAGTSPENVQECVDVIVGRARARRRQRRYRSRVVAGARSTSRAA